MVEQAVQTGSLDNLNTKKLLPSSKGAAGVQLNGRAAPPSSKSSSGTETRAPWGAHPLPPSMLLPGASCPSRAPLKCRASAGQTPAPCPLPLGWRPRQVAAPAGARLTVPLVP